MCGEQVGTKGMFTVTKDLGLKEPFSGQKTPIVSGEIAEDFTLLSCYLRTNPFSCWTECIGQY